MGWRTPPTPVMPTVAVSVRWNETFARWNEMAVITGRGLDKLGRHEEAAARRRSARVRMAWRLLGRDLDRIEFARPRHAPKAAWACQAYVNELEERNDGR